MGVLAGIRETFLLMIPAMVANGSAVLVARGRPIDGGRVFRDGRRLLGDGKTWEGLLVSLSFALIVSAPLALCFRSPRWILYGATGGFGAMLGDMAGSFIKRRMGLRRGSPVPLLDQLDFAAGAAVMLKMVGAPLTVPGLLAVSIIILVLHRATNIAAYKLGLKSVPW